MKARAGFHGVFLPMLLAVVLTWSAKILALASADLSTPLFWSAYAVWVGLSFFGVASLSRASTRMGPFRAAALFTVLVGAPFFFDFHAAVAREAPEKAILFAAAGFVGGAATLTLLRGVALSLAPRFSGRWRLLFLYVVVLVFEVSTLAFAPLLTFSSVPLPIPPARRWLEGDAAEVAEPDRIETALYVFVDPGQSDADRRALSDAAATTPDAAARRVVESLVRNASHAGAFEGPAWRKVVVLFPETTLSLSASAFRTFAAALRDLLTPYAVENGVEILMGARLQESNVVFRSLVDARLGRPLAGVVAAKTTFVPFYEVPWAGVSVREDDVSRAYEETSDEWLPMTPGAPVWGLSFPAPPQRPALICYEALFPWAWPVGGDALVLTNHDVFAKPGTASALYDFTLRQLARASGSSVFLVANKGTSGIFGVPFASADEDGGVTPRTDGVKPRAAYVVTRLNP